MNDIKNYKPKNRWEEERVPQNNSGMKMQGQTEWRNGEEQRKGNYGNQYRNYNKE